jgi:hypothetical protein
LSNTCPEEGLFDVGRRLVVAAKEANRRIGSIPFGRLVEGCKHGKDIIRLREFGRVTLWTDKQEVVTEGVVAGRLCNALLDGDVLSCLIVGDADVGVSCLEVLDAVIRVALDPSYLEGLLAARDSIFDVCIGELWKVSVGGFDCHTGCQPLIRPL